MGRDTVKEIVRGILVDYPQARDNDLVLIFIYRARVPELVHVPLLIKLPEFAPKKMPMLYTHYQLFEFIKHLTRIRK